MNRLKIFMLATIAILAFAGCSDDNNKNDDSAPAGSAKVILLNSMNWCSTEGFSDRSPEFLQMKFSGDGKIDGVTESIFYKEFEIREDQGVSKSSVWSSEDESWVLQTRFDQKGTRGQYVLQLFSKSLGDNYDFFELENLRPYIDIYNIYISNNDFLAKPAGGFNPSSMLIYTYVDREGNEVREHLFPCESYSPTLNQ